MLVSSGRFVNYRAEVHAFSIIGPRYGHFRYRRDRIRFVREWLQSAYFKLAGIDHDSVKRRVVDECSSTADFLRLIMQMMAEQQSVGRWAECTPANVFHIPEIQAAWPRAKFIHMIRDGRDVAMSLARQRWIEPLPWDRGKAQSVAALYWQRNVEIGRKFGKRVGDAYREVKFEDLVQRPEETLDSLSAFVDEDLDYETIIQNPVGSVGCPNSSFQQKGDFNPVGRWRDGMTNVDDIERLIGALLEEIGYELATSDDLRNTKSLKGHLYNSIWASRQWCRSNSFLGRFSDLTVIRDFSGISEPQP